MEENWHVTLKSSVYLHGGQKNPIEEIKVKIQQATSSFYFISKEGRRVAICGNINNKAAQIKILIKKGRTPL
jgi:hypothetical protein